MKVAVVKTGPGVTCPTATASRSCLSVNQCQRSTKSARRNANKTYPLPKSTAPTFRKNRNNAPRPRGTGGGVATTMGMDVKTDVGAVTPAISAHAERRAQFHELTAIEMFCETHE